MKSIHALVAIVALTLSACGPGGDPDPQPSVLDSVVLTYAQTLSGNVASTNSVTTDPPTLLVGDDDTNAYAQAFLRFYLSKLPPGAVVTKAVMILEVAGSIGNPQGTLGLLHVDHVDFGSVLDASDITPVVLESKVDSQVVNGIVDLDVESAVIQAQANGQTYVDLRLRFNLPTNNDSKIDLVGFSTEYLENNIDSPLLLHVTFERP